MRRGESARGEETALSEKNRVLRVDTVQSHVDFWFASKIREFCSVYAVLWLLRKHTCFVIA